MKYISISETGKRQINEDSVQLIKNKGFTCAIVCDGLGGHEAGEVASKCVVDSITHDFNHNPSNELEAINSYIHNAHDKLKDLIDESTATKSMLTTLALLILSENKLTLCHIGDTRIILYKKNEIFYETLDHRYVVDLIKQGEITEDEALVHPKRNVITKAMGMEGGIFGLQAVAFELDKAQISAITLCTDGFWENYSLKTLGKEIHKCWNLKSVVKKAKKDIISSPHYGDNFSAIIIKL